MNTQSGPLTIILSDLGGGGVQHAYLRLARGLVELGYPVDLTVFRLSGELATDIPEGVKVFELSACPGPVARFHAWAAAPDAFRDILLPVLLAPKIKWQLRYIPGLIRYLRDRKPRAVLSASLGYTNIVSYLAHRAASHPCRLVLSQHNPISQHLYLRGNLKNWQWRYARPLLRRSYTYADRIVAVSHSVAEDLISTLDLPGDKIDVVYNPVYNPVELIDSAVPAPHSWFLDNKTPVLLWVGRMATEKDIPNLFYAFARLREATDARLLLVGDGPRRGDLMRLRDQLGLNETVAFVGWHHQPQTFMGHADALVLCSRFEGLGLVAIEAMAAGCPVVATNCPGGVREIMDDGRFGRLVPPGDSDALARAIAETLAAPPSAEALRRRARDFSVDASAKAYGRVMAAADEEEKGMSSAI